MRLLLDEHIGPPVAVQLRIRGHDVLSVSDAALLHQSDARIFEWACDQRRAIVTADYRDYHALHERHLGCGLRHFGIVHIPRRFSLAAAGFGRLIEACEQLLTSCPGDDALESSETWL